MIGSSILYYWFRVGGEATNSTYNMWLTKIPLTVCHPSVKIPFHFSPTPKTSQRKEKKGIIGNRRDLLLPEESPSAPQSPSSPSHALPLLQPRRHQAVEIGPNAFMGETLPRRPRMISGAAEAVDGAIVRGINGRGIGRESSGACLPGKITRTELLLWSQFLLPKWAQKNQMVSNCLGIESYLTFLIPVFNYSSCC
jgi:hypothetical protein